MVQLYDQVCQHFAAEEKIEVSDWKSRLAAVPEPFLESCLSAIFSEHFSSEDSFFPPALSRATGTEDVSAFLPQAVLKALFNRERCEFLIHTYEKLGKAYFADAARFVLSYALFLAHSFRPEEYLSSNGAEMGQMLDQLEPRIRRVLFGSLSTGMLSRKPGYTDARNRVQRTDPRRGRNLLESAARRFEVQGETRWAAYIKALRHEYDAMIAVKRSTRCDDIC